MPKVEYLIVGQGLAGSILSFQLQKRKKEFLIIDKGHSAASSIVAAGIMNPMVLKRLTLCWRAEDFIGYNKTFYSELNSFFNKSFYQEIGFKKAIKSEDEKRFWEKKSTENSINNFVENELDSINNNKELNDFHFGKVNFTSWIDIKDFLKSYRDFLLAKDKIIEEDFNYSSLSLRKYKDISFEKIIFCEGRNAIENPFFNFALFSLTKGEVLTIKAPSLKSNFILKKGVFILPIGCDLYKVGATYEWKWLNDSPTERQKEKLIHSLKEIIKCDFSIVRQEAGVRPSVKDRRPILGKNQLIPNYFIFNGLGSRGCLMAPLLAEELINHIEFDASLDPETDISRFLSKPS